MCVTPRRRETPPEKMRETPRGFKTPRENAQNTPAVRNTPGKCVTCERPASGASTGSFREEPPFQCWNPGVSLLTIVCWHSHCSSRAATARMLRMPTRWSSVTSAGRDFGFMKNLFSLLEAVRAAPGSFRYISLDFSGGAALHASLASAARTQKRSHSAR
jgi:hypothetical protein